MDIFIGIKLPYVLYIYRIEYVQVFTPIFSSHTAFNMGLESNTTKTTI